MRVPLKFGIRFQSGTRKRECFKILPVVLVVSLDKRNPDVPWPLRA